MWPRGMTPVNAFAKWLAWGVCGMQGKWGCRGAA
jgi:hypothetical protein